MNDDEFGETKRKQWCQWSMLDAGNNIINNAAATPRNNANDDARYAHWRCCRFVKLHKFKWSVARWDRWWWSSGRYIVTFIAMNSKCIGHNWQQYEMGFSWWNIQQHSNDHMPHFGLISVQIYFRFRYPAHFRINTHIARLFFNAVVTVLRWKRVDLPFTFANWSTHNARTFDMNLVMHKCSAEGCSGGVRRCRRSMLMKLHIFQTDFGLVRCQFTWIHSSSNYIWGELRPKIIPNFLKVMKVCHMASEMQIKIDITAREPGTRWLIAG